MHAETGGGEVLDGDDRLAGLDEPVAQAEQLLDGGGVEAGGRLGEDGDAALVGGRRARFIFNLGAVCTAGESSRVDHECSPWPITLPSKEEDRHKGCGGRCARHARAAASGEPAAEFFAGGRDAGHHRPKR
ncbi:hypothetical protein [Pseudonocardia nigra]|uniref:hypothetical protein n=1 Tax=Pseudonocardia nigra TaxID=1921578 RepID=UPI001C5DFDDD|nr:hypothetical protein [Pseudonocardia nigra]